MVLVAWKVKEPLEDLNVRGIVLQIDRWHVVQLYTGGQYHKPRLGRLSAHARWGRFKASGSPPPIRQCLPLGILDRGTPGSRPNEVHKPGRGIIETGYQQWQLQMPVKRMLIGLVGPCLAEKQANDHSYYWGASLAPGRSMLASELLLVFTSTIRAPINPVRLNLLRFSHAKTENQP